MDANHLPKPLLAWHMPQSHVKLHVDKAVSTLFFMHYLGARLPLFHLAHKIVS